MDEDDLENTMRHGLEELANDAPRGDGLWETTTSMIAITPDTVPPESDAKPPPRNLALEPRAPVPPAPPTTAVPPTPAAPAPSPRERSSGLALGIAIGIAIGALIIAAIAIVMVIRNNNSSPKPDNSVPGATATATSVPGARPETTAILPAGPIPAGDVVFNDDANARIVVADGLLNEVGLIVPSKDGQWRALQASNDRTHLYVVKGGGKCDELWDLDLVNRKLKSLVKDANIVALSPDASRAIVAWDDTCTGVTPGTVALRTLGQESDVELKEVSFANRVNVAWSPDGTRFAVEPVASHHVDTYDSRGAHVGDFDRPRSSQDGIGWTSDGLVLVDLGNDHTAVLRIYDPVTGATDNKQLARVPQVNVGGNTGPLVVPQVTAIRQSGGRTYVELAGGAGNLSYAQLRVVDQGRIPVIVDGFYSRHFVG